jgi:hypothetical protein
MKIQTSIWILSARETNSGAGRRRQVLLLRPSPAPHTPRPLRTSSKLSIFIKCTRLGRDSVAKKLMPGWFCGKKKWPGPIFALQSNSFVCVGKKGVSARYLAGPSGKLLPLTARLQRNSASLWRKAETSL